MGEKKENSGKLSSNSIESQHFGPEILRIPRDPTRDPKRKIRSPKVRTHHGVTRGRVMDRMPFICTVLFSHAFGVFTATVATVAASALHPRLWGTHTRDGCDSCARNGGG